MDIEITSGESIPPLVITIDSEIAGKHLGTVKAVGCRLLITGTVNGTLRVTKGATVVISGAQNGTVSVDAGSTIQIFGKLNGTTRIAHGATIQVERGGRLAGALINDGHFILSGAFGGPYKGSGERTITDTGYIQQPVVRDGISYYEW